MADQNESSNLQTTSVPYPPSWIDHFIKWIAHLPGPTWLFYLLAILMITVLLNVTLWIDGSLPLGSIGAFPGIFPPAVLYFLALYHYLTQVGSRSLRNFRPLLDVNDAEFTRIDFELSNLPRRLGWWSIPLGFILATVYLLGDSATLGGLEPQTSLPRVVAFVIYVPFIAMSLCLLARSIRQLRAIRKLHTMAIRINLLELKPAHAFSVLTAQTGIGLILVGIISYFYDPSGAFSSGSFIIGYAMTVLVALIIFVTPLLGMRDKLEVEKERALNNLNNLLQTTSGRLHNKITKGDYDDLGGMETALGALIRERELTEKISTWPWSPLTLRSFASTLLLPIFLWLVTRLLENYL